MSLPTDASEPACCKSLIFCVEAIPSESRYNTIVSFAPKRSVARSSLNVEPCTLAEARFSSVN